VRQDGSVHGICQRITVTLRSSRTHMQACVLLHMDCPLRHTTHI